MKRKKKSTPGCRKAQRHQQSDHKSAISDAQLALMTWETEGGYCPPPTTQEIRADIVREHQDFVMRVALRMVPREAEDITQDVWLNLLPHIDQMVRWNKPWPEDVEAWQKLLFTIIRNLACTYWRRKGRHREQNLPNLPDVADAKFSLDAALIAQEYFDALPVRERDVIALLLEGYSQVEAAVWLEVTRKTVHNRRRRAGEYLQDRFGIYP